MLEQKRIPVWSIYVIVVGGMAAFFLGLLYLATNDDLRNLIIGVAGGLVVWLLTLFTQVQPLRRLQQIQNTGFIGVQANRHEKEYYRLILERANNQVWVTGASASRFVTDFLRTIPDSDALLTRMRSTPTLKVRLLVPTIEHMRQESRNSFENVREDIERLKADFPDRFEIRFFREAAHMSFVLTENDFVGGPVLPKEKSTDTPVIHLKAETKYALHHRAYFDQLWSGALAQP